MYLPASKPTLISISVMVLCNMVQAQPDIAWQRALGGMYEDHVEDLAATLDGGYIAVGYAYSNDGDVSGQQGEGDGWVVKLDGNGDLVWQQCLGGSLADKLFTVLALPDGGCLAAGVTNSDDGDVSGAHGLNDAWVVRLDPAGTLLWQRCLGGSGNDAANSLVPAAGGGYFLTGVTDSPDGDVIGLHGVVGDGWVVKLDDQGDIAWQRCLGGTGSDIGHDVLPRADGGVIVALASNSVDGDVTAPLGDMDAWLVKLDSVGSIEWDVSAGGMFMDLMYPSLAGTADGGFAMLGQSLSVYGFPGTCTLASNRDVYLVRFDASGTQLWHRCYGGPWNDAGADLLAMADGGFTLAGTVELDGCDVGSVNGVLDLWLVRVDASGILLWERACGGSLGDVATSLVMSPDGNLAMGGYTLSSDGDVTGQHGDADGWVVRFGLDDVGIGPTEGPSVQFWQAAGAPQLHVFLPDPGAFTWWVSDARGAVVAQGTVRSGSVVLDLKGLNAGAYWITFQEGGRRTTRSFFLQ